MGQGRCKLHGGSSPVKHGRYSTITRPRIAELLGHFTDDPEPLNLLPEVALLRAIVVDFAERYDEHVEALLAWHASYGKEDATPKPKQVYDYADVARIVELVGKMVDRVQRRNTDALQHPEVKRVTAAMAAVVLAAVPDAAMRNVIYQGWDAIPR